MTSLPVLVLLAALATEPAPESVREQRSFAVWTDPQLFFHGLGSGRADLAGSDISTYPLGIELGRQLGAHLLLSVGVSRVPFHDIEATQATLGGRWYFLTGTAAPYLGGEVGWKRETVDDTGGKTHSDLFAAVGPGVEVTFRSGFSLSTDLLLGPENHGDVRSDARTWYLSAWYRIGLGYRF